MGVGGTPADPHFFIVNMFDFLDYTPIWGYYYR
jgi:hypothetical protein